jgi:Fe-S oxidoreductase
MFGAIATLNRLGSRLAPVSNRVAGWTLNRWLLERVAGIDRRRPLPRFAAETFEAWYRRHVRNRHGDTETRTPGDGEKGREGELGSGVRGSVVLFHDTFNNYNTPAVAVAATRLLEASGYRVLLADKRCCGRPMISKGMLAQAKENAAWNVETLAPYVRQGVPIVGLEPSCLLTLRDEYPDFLRSEAAREVADHAFLLEEFLAREASAGKFSFDLGGAKGRALLHGHCHQKALIGTGPTLSVLRAAGFEVSEIDSGCCGMAGSFGFEKEHYEISVAIGNRRLAPAVREAAPDVEIVAPGISCRQQIEHLTGRHARHPAEVLWNVLSAASRPAAVVRDRPD